VATVHDQLSRDCQRFSDDSLVSHRAAVASRSRSRANRSTSLACVPPTPAPLAVQVADENQAKHWLYERWSPGLCFRDAEELPVHFSL
jgi:hypothetical protein